MVHKPQNTVFRKYTAMDHRILEMLTECANEAMASQKAGRSSQNLSKCRTRWYSHSPLFRGTNHIGAKPWTFQSPCNCIRRAELARTENKGATLTLNNLNLSRRTLTKTPPKADFKSFLRQGHYPPVHFGAWRNLLSQCPGCNGLHNKRSWTLVKLTGVYSLTACIDINLAREEWCRQCRRQLKILGTSQTHECNRCNEREVQAY